MSFLPRKFSAPFIAKGFADVRDLVEGYSKILKGLWHVAHDFMELPVEDERLLVGGAGGREVAQALLHAAHLVEGNGKAAKSLAGIAQGGAKLMMEGQGLLISGQSREEITSPESKGCQLTQQPYALLIIVSPKNPDRLLQMPCGCSRISMGLLGQRKRIESGCLHARFSPEVIESKLSYLSSYLDGLSRSSRCKQCLYPTKQNLNPARIAVGCLR